MSLPFVKKNYLFILTLGVFSILNTEMGIIGIMPTISEQYGISLTVAGMLVSIYKTGNTSSSNWRNCICNL